jgi:hypothetical protein
MEITATTRAISRRLRDTGTSWDEEAKLHTFALGDGDTPHVRMAGGTAVGGVGSGQSMLVVRRPMFSGGRVGVLVKLGA